MSQSQRRQRLHVALFAGPALLIFLAFAAIPLLATLVLGFFRSVDGKAEFAGLGQFIDILTGSAHAPRFWGALWNNLKFFLIHLIVELPVGLLLAAMLTSGAVRRAASIYRTLIFIPTTLSVVIVAFIWRMIINPLWGLVDYPLLAEPRTALPTIAMMSVWQYVGIPMIFLYAALLAVPDEVVEAARMDGAGPWRLFWAIKFPLIAPQFALISILTFIATFNGFDIVFAIAGASAGPEYSTDLLGTYFFRSFYGVAGGRPDTYFGSAVAGLVFLILLVVSATYFAVLTRRSRREVRR